MITLVHATFFLFVTQQPREHEAQRGEATSPRSPRQNWQRRWEIQVYTTKRLSSCHYLFYSTSQCPGSTSPQTMQDHLALCPLPLFPWGSLPTLPLCTPTIIAAAAVRRALTAGFQSVPSLGPGFLFQAKSKDVCHTFPLPSITPRSCHRAKASSSTTHLMCSTFPVFFCFVLL